MVHRLAAIFCADQVVGLRPTCDSTATPDGGQVTLRRTIESLIVSYNGRVVKFTDRQIFAEFASMVDAVQCAIAIRSKQGIAIAGQLRIGIDLAEVADEDDRFSGFYGDVACQLCCQADPGDTLMSQAAYEQVRDKLSYTYTALGEIRVDRSERKIGVFQLTHDEPGGVKTPRDRRGKLRVGAAIFAACATLAVVVALLPYLQSHVSQLVDAVLSKQQPVAVSRDTISSPDQDLIETALEVTFWNAVNDTGDSEALRTYVARYPQGQFAEVALARLSRPGTAELNGKEDGLRDASTGGEAAAVARWEDTFLAELRRQVLAEMQAQEQAELTEWRAIRASVEPTVLQTYLIRYPDGTYSSLARDQMQIAKDRQLGILQANLEAEQSVSAPADDPEDDELTEAGLTLLIQRHLARLGCNPGRPDGVWGSASERALRAYVRHSKIQLANLQPNTQLLNVLEVHTEQVCPLQCGPRHTTRNGRCVLKECRTGQVLTGSGTCIAKAETPKDNKPEKQSSKNDDQDCAYCWNYQGMGSFKRKYCGDTLKRRKARGGGVCSWSYYDGQYD